MPRKIITTAIVLLISLVSWSNNIKVGTGNLTVTVKGDSTATDQISVWVSTSPIFSGLMENEMYQLDKTGDHSNNNYRTVFTGNIPMELDEEFVGITIETPENSPGIPIEIKQNSPKEIIIELNANGSLKSFVDKDPEAYSLDELMSIIEAAGNYYQNPVGGVPDSLYTSWREVRKYETEVLLPQVLNLTLDTDKIPEKAFKWLKNRILSRFASQIIIPYTAAAKRENGLDVEEPPMEAYTFLDSIDYSDILLKSTPYCGLKPFLYTLLRFPEGGFEKIGETPVNEWEEKASAKLSRAIKKPVPLLLNLLSAMSYVEQIDENNQNLTSTQIDNIKSGYSNDLGKIILMKDSILKCQRETNLIDLTAQNFNLKKYIDEHYQGQPVIVDLWNTWCSPCLDAIQMTKQIKNNLSPRSNNIVFLFLSDTSSPENTWRSKAPAIGGDQIRISSEEISKLFKDYGMDNLFPSYFVFDKNHKLVNSVSGFPGTETYMDWLIRLSE